MNITNPSKDELEESKRKEKDESDLYKLKWWVSFLVAIIAAIIFSPLAYCITSSITTSVGGMRVGIGNNEAWIGLILHFIIFFFAVRFLLIFF